MKKINKQSPPTLFIQYIRAEFASYDDMDSDVKNALKESLLGEQFGICAYCQQKLDIAKMTIEHHCERSICNGSDGTEDKRLDYNNLFAVCEGKGGVKNDLHCDTKKAQFNINSGLPMTVCPTIDAHISTIQYNSTGKIKSSNELYDKELNEILNLNAPHLQDMRKSKWHFFMKYGADKNGNLNKEKMKRLLDNDMATKDGQYCQNFPGMCEYMKKKFCTP